MYPMIDSVKSGNKLKRIFESAGYSVRDIQEYLHLSCPQPVYRWYKGNTLPTVDHLYALSILLGMHMEDLLVAYKVFWDLEYYPKERIEDRYQNYYIRISSRVFGLTV